MMEGRPLRSNCLGVSSALSGCFLAWRCQLPPATSHLLPPAPTIRKSATQLHQIHHHRHPDEYRPATTGNFGPRDGLFL